MTDNERPEPDAQPPPDPAPPPPSPDPWDEAAESAGEIDAPPSFPIVGVGASAGGLDAYRQLLHALPSNTGMAFVLIQHLDPTHESMLGEILARDTAMPVMVVQDEPKIEPNHIYVIPPNRTMVMTDGSLKLLPREQPRGQHRPVDSFLRALAVDRSHRAIGVILSGTGSDGTLGLEAIKGEGGITFAQDASAQHGGMPRSAVASGCVDFVLAPDAIAAELARIGKHPYVKPIADIGPQAESTMTRVLRLLRDATGVDFSQYRPTTLYRRVTRRMLLHKLEGLPDYLRYLQTNSAEVQWLFRDILISVTSFFRDPEAFAALKAKVFPRLLAGRGRGDPLRVWVLGCSTGEEAYSLAISLAEFSGEQPGMSQQTIQVFATDLNEEGIEKARAGIYSRNIAQDVSPDRLRRFFVETEGGYQITKSIRDMCVFARQNVLSDPPFSRMDFISCRNLLIYLEPVLQRKVIPLFHYALKPNGFLWLGSTETIGGFAELFQPENSKCRIYLKKTGAPGPFLGLPIATLGWERDPTGVDRPRRRQVEATGGMDVQREADRVALAKYAPPSVLVNAELDVLQFRGDTGPYLMMPPGKPSVNLLKMAREGLLVGLRVLLQKAAKEGRAVRQEGLSVKVKDRATEVNVEVLPIRAGPTNERCLLVVFEDAAQTRAPGKKEAKAVEPPPGAPEEVERQFVRVTQELAATREYMQSLIEQQEAANEELQSANEEVQSSNEELQSINEELQTSKEEIQSANEELMTVNEELRNRNEQLSQFNNDLTNFLGSSQMALVMVGPDLRIRRFTPVAEKVLSLIGTDIGRPIGDLQLPLGVPDLEQRLNHVIDTVSPQEEEVQDRQGRWYSLRLRPYKTLDNKIDGAVLVLIDLDAQKRTEAALRVSEERFSGIVRQVAAGIAQVDLSGRFVLVNDRYCEMVGRSREVLLRLRWHDITHPEDVERTRDLYERAVNQGESSTIESRFLRPDGSAVWVNNSVAAIKGSDGQPQYTVAVMIDISNRVGVEEALRDAGRHKDEFLATLAHELRNPLAPLAHTLEFLRLSSPDADVMGQCREVMERQVRKLQRLVDDLLDMSRISRGKIELRQDGIDLVAVVSTAVESGRQRAEARQHELKASLPGEPIYVVGDSIRLEQIVENLLGNAIKYTNPGGRIDLTLSLEGGEAILRVRDNGIGIAPDLLPRVFTLFTQADTSYSRDRGGLGIGLPLARQLILLHGGSVQASSPGLGQGSEFVVRLPTHFPSQPPKVQPGPAVEVVPVAKGNSCRVLVVDDNVDAAKSLARLLMLDGHEVQVAHNGLMALEVAPAFGPQVVLMDIGMPGMDGYEVARRMRRMEELAQATVVAVSGYGREEDRQLSREAGFDLHVVKPVNWPELQALVARAGAGR